MRIGRTLKIVFVVVPVVLIAGIAGTVAVLAGLDFNQYKPLIAEQTKKATGRDLAIAGDLKLDISLTPAVAVSGVTLSNAAWSERRDMVTVERFEAQVALWPLLFGDIEVKRIVLIGADIVLEVDGQGRANFDFQAAGAATPEEAQSGEFAIPVIHEVVVRDSKLVYADAKAGATYEVGIDTLTLTGDGPGEPLNLLYEGDYNGRRVKLVGVLGAPADLMKPDSPWPVDLVLEAGGARVTVKGTIAEPAAAKGLDLAVSVAGDELGDLAAIAGAQVPKAGPYSLSAKLSGDPASAIRLSGLKAALGGSDLAGDVTIDLSGAKPVIDADLSSDTVDLAALGGGSGGGAKQVKKQSAKIFSGDPLPLAGLRAVDATLRYRAGTIVTGGARLQDATVGVTLKGGNLTVAPIKAAIGGGSLVGTVTLDGRKDIAGLAAKIKFANVDLGELLAEMKISGDLEGRASLDLDVAGRGDSVAKIMAGLNGHAVLLMGKGRMKSLALQTLIGGPTQILGKVFTGGDSDYTVINCAVVRFPVKNGLATAEPLVLDTDVAVFTGTGTINLATEKPDLMLDPKVKKTTISAAVPVHIEGTLANPEYSPDKLAAARKIGGLLGVVLFPPAAILGLGELGAGADNPCVQQAKSGGGTAKKKEETGVAAGVLKSAGEGITKGLQSLFGD